MVALPTSSAIASGASPAAPSAADPTLFLGGGGIAASFGNVAASVLLRIRVGLAAGLDSLADRVCTGADAQKSQYICWNIGEMIAVLGHHQEETQRDHEGEDQKLESRNT